MRTPRTLPTASGLQLAHACPASQALPVVDTSWRSGELGRDKHEALAGLLATPQATAHPEASASWVAGIDDPEFTDPLRGSFSEAAFAWDVASGKGRLLGFNLGRNYDVAPSEFAGAADYYRPEPGGVSVVDLKTGLGDVPHPSRNAQLRFLALAAARWHGVESARVGILHAPEGQTPRWAWATLDAFELETVALELRTLAERIAKARRDVYEDTTPRLTVGEHCTYCPARHGCPARVAMAQRLAGEPEKVVLDLKAMLTPETAALALARWQAARKALEEVGGALHAYASESPIPLGDGRVWGPRESKREVIDAEKAWPVLVESYGAEVARKAMSLDTSKTGVARALAYVYEEKKQAGEKTTKKALLQTTLGALRLAGAIDTKTSKTFEAYTVTSGIGPGELNDGEDSTECASTAGPAVSVGQ